ncbi:MAG TPA: hypothetical protein VM370_12405 [Candidatus Thermoplasmatota archaeon]|nr:hypothetical protein [Candidatus Thermoplasmatota archaeon]
MVKESRALADELAQEGVAPYEATPLARRAVRARRRLAILLLVGVAGVALEAALRRDLLLALGAIAIAFAAQAVRAKRLAGVVAAAFAALLAVLVPIALMMVFDRPTSERILLAFVVGWGLALLPDVVLLLQDAELQHAYGLWARRGS